MNEERGELHVKYRSLIPIEIIFQTVMNPKNILPVWNEGTTIRKRIVLQTDYNLLHAILNMETTRTLSGRE